MSFTWDWNIIIGSAISFAFAVILVFFNDIKRNVYARRKIKKKMIAFFNAFLEQDNKKKYHSLVKLAKSIEIRTMEEITNSIGNIWFEYRTKKESSTLTGEIKSKEQEHPITYSIDINQKIPLIVKTQNIQNIWIRYDTTDYNLLLSYGTSFIFSLKEKKRYSFNEPNTNVITLISFLDFLEKKYRENKIIGKKRTLLKDSMKEQLKKNYFVV